MRVTQLRIKNYRSFGSEVKIDVPSSHVVLVGGNNVGKSTIVSALDLVLGSRSPWRIRMEPDDYFDPKAPIELEATIGEVSPGEKSQLFSLCSSKKQKGALSAAENPEVNIAITIPAWESAGTNEDEGDEDGTAPTKVELRVQLWGFTLHRRGDDVRRALARSIVASPHRRIDADLSASRWTPYGRLMKEILESSPEFADLCRLLDEANTKVQAAFANQKQDLLKGARVVSYVDDIEFRLTEHGNPVELLRNLEIFVDEGGRRINIDHVGTGTQSAIIIGMLELVLRASSALVRILCVEEPESFIHPHGIRRLGRLLREIAEESGVQVLLVSHSPSLVATLSPGDVIRVEEEDGESRVYQSRGELGGPHFARYVTADTAEMFFAKRVILVEGDTERYLLPSLARLVSVDGIRLDLDRARISVIAMGSKDSIVNYLTILDAFSIDAWAILDADFLKGSSLRSLLTYLGNRGAKIDDSTESTLRRDLLKEQIIVLSKGEIEDYIPDTDVAEASGKPLDTVRGILASHTKRSSGLKEVFGTGKPQYAMTLASYYLSAGKLPSDLERLVRRIAT